MNRTPNSTSWLSFMAVGRWTILLLIAFWFAVGAASAAVSPEVTGIAMEAGKLYLATDATNAFIVERKLPDSGWEALGLSTLPATGGMEWYRVISLEHSAGGDPTTGDALVFTPPSATANPADLRPPDPANWVMIGEISPESGMVNYNPVVGVSAPSFDAPAAAGNNHATATPDPGRVKAYWFNSNSLVTACWIFKTNGLLKSYGLSNQGTMTSGWQLKGAGDINRDGISDLIWYNSGTTLVAYWLMAPDGYVNSSGLCNPSGMSAGWELRGVGDINRDGTADILWHNSISKRVAYWILNSDGTLNTSGFCNDGTMSGGWVLSGVGDINHDNTCDILWYNSSTRRVAYWFLNTDGTLGSSGYCSTNPMAAGWEFRAVGDINNPPAGSSAP